MAPRRARASRFPAYIRGMKGLHLIADLYRCRCEGSWLTDASQLQAWCTAAVDAVGLEALAEVFQPLPGGGVSGTVLMAGAQLCVHAWPQEKAVSADLYLGQAGADPSAKARSLMHALIQRFQPEWTEQRSLERGEE